jgi:DNA primase
MQHRSEDARRVIEAVSITALIGEDVALTPWQGRLRGRCAWHHDVQQSLFVAESSSAFHCFGCGAGGDALDWVMLRDRVSEASALRALASKARKDVQD